MQRVNKLLHHFTNSTTATTANVAARHFCAKTSSTSDDSGVLIEEQSSGNYLVTLNRPKALNALNAAMINKLTPFYQSLIDQQKHCIVVVKGSGDKAFCAGGDVKHLWDLGKAGRPLEEVTNFFKIEYILDNLLHTLPSYIHNVSLLNGITMGGGVGISVHGKYRVCTDNTLFAMPETGIGFYTDVGGAYFLPRLVPRGLGMYLALTGHRLKGDDCLHAGIGTHFVKKENLNFLENELLNTKYPQQTASILAEYSEHHSKLNEFSLKNNLSDIHKYFDMDNVQEMYNAIENDCNNKNNNNNEFLTKCFKSLKSVSPTSLKVIFRALHEGNKLTLRETLDMEYDIVSHFMKGGDFYEGVRSVLVDKDKNPKWNPPTLDQVKDSDIDEYFPRFSPK